MLAKVPQSLTSRAFGLDFHAGVRTIVATMATEPRLAALWRRPAGVIDQSVHRARPMPHPRPGRFARSIRAAAPRGTPTARPLRQKNYRSCRQLPSTAALTLLIGVAIPILLRLLGLRLPQLLFRVGLIGISRSRQRADR